MSTNRNALHKYTSIDRHKNILQSATGKAARIGIAPALSLAPYYREVSLLKNNIMAHRVPTSVFIRNVLAHTFASIPVTAFLRS